MKIKDTRRKTVRYRLCFQSTNGRPNSYAYVIVGHKTFMARDEKTIEKFLKRLYDIKMKLCVRHVNWNYEKVLAEPLQYNRWTDMYRRIDSNINRAHSHHFPNDLGCKIGESSALLTVHIY